MNGNWIRHKFTYGWWLLILPCAVLLALWIRQPQPARASLQPIPPAQKPDNSLCLGCHSSSDKVFTAGKDSFATAISSDAYDASVHSNLACQVCHPNITGYPHPQNTAATGRDYTLQYKDTCKQCHPDQVKALGDSLHTKFLENGNKNAPICADCHNPHTQLKVQKDSNGNPAPAEYATIAKICSNCHSTIYNEYAQSVHGKGVLVDKNPDVPACTECHGVHTVVGPDTAQFRNGSPQMCGKCHTDQERMSKYGLSTDVLNTYVSDFHGTTVTLFEKQNPDQITNKPVCYDCHGVHNISSIDDPQNGLQIKTNLLAACKKCHPDATTNFPDSWLSHYIPSPTHAPLVYYVQLFYTIFIPLVLGGMAFFVITDIVRRQINRRKPAAAVKE